MSKDGDLVFVGMPFGDKKDAAFKKRCDSVFKAIDDVCDALELEADRVDQYVGSSPITPKIKRMIRRADYLIFDLTGERPNVYYEIGFAHGVEHNGTNMILIAEEGTRLHFDLAHRAVKFFSDTDELRDILREELEAMVPADE